MSLRLAGGDADDAIEMVKRNVRIGTRNVRYGRVRVSPCIAEDRVSESATMASEHIGIERRPADVAVKPGVVTFRDRIMEPTETAEETVVSKEARTVGKIGLRQRSGPDTEAVTDAVRPAGIEIEDDRTGRRRDERDPF